MFPPYTLNTYSFIQSSTVEQNLIELSDKGYDSFELMIYPGYLWPAAMDAASRTSLGRLIDQRNLTITSLNMPNLDLNIVAASPDMRDHTQAALLRAVELAGNLGVPNVVIGPGKVNPLHPEPHNVVTEHLFHAFDVLVPATAKHGTKLLVENMPFAYLPDSKSLTDTLNKYGSEEIGIVYDIANAAFIREDFESGLKLCLDRLELVHVSDTRFDVYQHAPVGTGAIDFTTASDALTSVGFTGKPVIEVVSTSSEPLREIEQSITALDSLGWVRPAFNSSREA